jgi:cytochrome c-type biogenesis protein CcsB
VNLEYYSNLAFVASVVVYALAMLAHASEWATARKLDENASAEGMREPALAAVGAGESAVGGRAALAPTGSSRTAVPPSKGADRRRVDQFGRVGIALTVIGLGLSVVGVVLRGLTAQRAPWGNMFEFTTAAMVFVVAAYLIMVWRVGLRWLGLPVTLLATIGNGLAVTVFYVAVAPLVPALHSVWFLIHIVAAALAGAAFNVGAVLSLLYLIRQRAERHGRLHGYLARLPESRRLDVLAYRFTAFAFPVWTFAVAAGAVWAEYAWGRYWGWDPKETWALVTWVIYAGYLHARATAGWRGTRAAMINLVGVASFWFNFIGINLLVSGLHSYAGV